MRRAEGTKDPANKFWHRSYLKSEELGEHLHEWSHAIRDEAGRELARRAVKEYQTRGRMFKALSLAERAEAIAKVPFFAGSGIEGVYGYSIGDELRLIIERGYIRGYLDPELVGMEPDAVCESGEEDCITSYSRGVKNPTGAAQEL